MMMGGMEEAGWCEQCKCRHEYSNVQCI